VASEPASLAFADRIDRCNAAVGRVAAWLCLIEVLVQFAVVVLRYVFDFGLIWLSESIIYAHAGLFMLAAAWTLRDGGHVRVDIFYAEASPRTRALVELGGSLLLLLPFVLVLGWFALPYVARSWAILERSPETGGIPAVFLLKTLIPLFALMMALQGVAQAIRALNVLHTRPVTPGLDPPAGRNANPQNLCRDPSAGEGPRVHPSSQDGLPGQARQ
jgi:TRAP-type mannitol/chloroaromatic compound transport system permease small subunit